MNANIRHIFMCMYWSVWLLWAYLRCKSGKCGAFVHSMVENGCCLTDACLVYPRFFTRHFTTLTCQVSSAKEFPLSSPRSDFLPPAACFQASQILHHSYNVSPIVRLDLRVSEFAWGERRESWGNIIFELFSEMTALAPSKVFITGHFKTLNLSKPDCFTSSRRPPPLVLTHR